MAHTAELIAQFAIIVTCSIQQALTGFIYPTQGAFSVRQVFTPKHGSDHWHCDM